MPAGINVDPFGCNGNSWSPQVTRARVTCGDQEFPLQPKGSTFIPAGTVHRLENPGSEMLEVIEVQTGSYFGEDDIERFDDDFDRS